MPLTATVVYRPDRKVERILISGDLADPRGLTTGSFIPEYGIRMIQRCIQAAASEEKLARPANS